jgi:tetratricopeptide (TPR) repeat protein
MSRVTIPVALALMVLLTGCAARTAPAPVPLVPAYPTYVQPAIPPELTATPAQQQQYDLAWQRLQAGDLQAAAGVLGGLLRESPQFYPAETVLGDIALIEQRYGDALGYFTAAAARNPSYLPALEGRVTAALEVGDDLATASALEQLLAADPTREEARGRLGLIRLRIVQGQLAAAAEARTAGRLDEAQALIERALQAAPPSPVLLRELAAIELTRGAVAPAERHAREAVELDRADPESLATLAAVLEATGRTGEAADAYATAVSLDPRPAWREKRDALRERARYEALPAEYRAIPESAAVTRAQVAAAIGLDLESLLARAARTSAVVVTDVRAHWAAPWILPVTQAGVMDIYPNHTFQPNATVRRSDLAQIASQLLAIVAAVRPEDAARWRAARPRLEDVPAGFVSYRAIALSVGAGVMALDESGRFWPARPATGAELLDVIDKIKQFSE